MPEGITEPPVDGAFKQIRKNVTLFLIWRVENMHLTVLPKEQYGIFHEGDCYLIYAASESGAPAFSHMKIEQVRSKAEMHIHFWIGNESSKDESTIAAYKCVELDKWLGGTPVQHREIQGNESSRFKGYFKNGIRLLKGGVSSGLVHVNNLFEPRLFRIKGRRSPVTYQMPSISWEHFSSGDVFILDTKDVIFLWIGKHANNMEKLQAAVVAQKLKSEHNALSIVFVDDGKEMQLPDSERTLLGLHLDPKIRRGIKIDTNDGDQIKEITSNAELKLYRCSDEGGTYRVTEVKMGPLLQTDLNSNDSYIIDKSGTAIWVWVGKYASPKERVEAIRNAYGFVKKKNYASNIPVSRTLEGGEPIEFKCLFKTWNDCDHNVPAISTSLGRSNKNIPAKLDMETLQSLPHVASKVQLMDDGSGKVSIWRLQRSLLIDVPYEAYGRFYSASCYLIHYKYTSLNKEYNTLYYWIGRHCSKADQATLISLTESRDDRITEFSTQVRVMESKEPAHFLIIFHGRSIVFSGEHSDRMPQKFLISVTGNRQHNAKATQVPLNASSLNSNKVFILMYNENNCYVWCGKGSTGDEREVAKNIAHRITKDDIVVFYEGQEKEEFWTAIGNRAVYSNEKEMDVNSSTTARLFHCIYTCGSLKVEEIMNFHSSDLLSEDVLLLDIRSAIYIWVGKYSNREEKKHVFNIAQEYLRADPSERDLNIPLIIVRQSYEPVSFTGFFPTWEQQLPNKEKSFNEIRCEIEKQNPVLQVELKISNGTCEFEECEKYPIEKLLVKNPDKLPCGVDPTLKELHLTEDEFSRVFGMKYHDFAHLPQWRKDNMKKSAGLF